MDFPIFNAVGNHDVSIRQNYVKHFGKTYYDFSYGSELYIFLDSELDDSRFIGKQLDFFTDVIKQKANNSNIRNVFVFSHKLIWAVNIKKYEVVYNNSNSQDGYKQYENFNNVMIPILADLSKAKNVFWISGDIGSFWSLPLFYDKDSNTGITFIATGLGDTKNDLILKIDIKPDDVTVYPLSLGNEEMEKVANDYLITLINKVETK